MFLSNFIYIIKRVLTSPSVIAIVIAAILYLSLVFYILNYSKQKKTYTRKKSKNTKEMKKKEKEESEADEDDGEKEKDN